MNRPKVALDDGLTEFAVWTERDVEQDRLRVCKIEPYDPTRLYPSSLSGIVRAKDELDVYRYIESYNR